MIKPILLTFGLAVLGANAYAAPVTAQNPDQAAPVSVTTSVMTKNTAHAIATIDEDRAASERMAGINEDRAAAERLS